MERYRLKGILTTLAVLAGILLASALLAPVLHRVLPYPFARIFRRLVMIGTILGVVVFVRFRKDLFVRFGMAWTRDSVRFLLAGFVTGLTALILFIMVGVVAGHADVVVRHLTVFGWIGDLSAGLAGAILIGIVEEFVLRGFVFTYARDVLFRGRVVPGMVATSLLYASLHFLNPREPAISADPGFFDSLMLIVAPLQSLSDWQAMWSAGIGLFLFGMVLNWCVVRSGSLYPAIGLHAGCVTFLRVVPLFIWFGRTDRLLWGTKMVYDGALAWGCLLLMGVVMARFLRTAPPAA